METDLAKLDLENGSAATEQVLSAMDRLLEKNRSLEVSFQSLQRVSGITFGKLGRDLGIFSGLGRALGGDLGKILGTSFDRFLLKGREAGDVVKSLEKDLLKLGDRYFRTALGGGGTGGGLVNGLFSEAGDFVSNLFAGFAGGGQFMVGGAAGRDRNLVGLRLTRGERVTVETPAQQRQNKPASPLSAISVNFQINTPDADSFRRSQSQIQADALRSAQRLIKRNG